MKRLSLIILVMAMFMWANNALSTYTILDTTDVRPGKTNSDADGPVSGGGSWKPWTDVVGRLYIFDVYGINVTFGTDSLTFELYTNYDGRSGTDGTIGDGHYRLGNSSIHTYLADFFLDVDQDGVYDHGVVLIDHGAWTQGLRYGDGSNAVLPNLDVGLYSVSSFYTAHDFFEGHPSARYYGQRYDDGGGDPGVESIVAIGGGSLLGAASIGFEELPLGTGSDAANPNNVWSFTIDPDDLIGYSGGPMDVFWAGANCSNDAIRGTVPPIPEPTTILLMVTGLIGIAAHGLKRRKKS